MAQSNKLNRNERREAARKEAERLRNAQAAHEKRSRVILIIVIVAVVALIAVAGVVIAKNANKTLLSDFDGPVPAQANDHGGISFGADGAGAENKGKPTLEAYVDFMCPACGQFEQTNGEEILKAVKAGEMTMVYHPLGFLNRFSQGTNYSTRAASAFAYVAQNEPDKALDFMAALFNKQPEENSAGLSDEEIQKVAEDAGVSQDVVDKMTDGTYKEWVDTATDQATRDGVQATPTVKLNGDIWNGNWSQPGEVMKAVKNS